MKKALLLFWMFSLAFLGFAQVSKQQAMEADAQLVNYYPHPNANGELWNGKKLPKITNGEPSLDDFWIEVDTGGEWFHHPVGRNIDTVYVASMHGVYRSVDTCQTWQCVGLENQSVDFLYLSEDDELYASIASTSPLYKWGGNSWNMLHYSSFSAPWAFIKASDGTLYVGDNRGIRMSVDGGDSWWQSWDNPHEGVSVVNGFVELDNGTLFACLTGASDYHTGVIRSTDHGGTWHPIGLDSNYYITFAKSREGIIYAGCSGYNSDEDVGVFRTVDNGETWEMLNGDYYVYSVALDDNDNVYIAHSDYQGFYRSNDGGYSYENISAGMDYLASELYLLPDGYLLSYEYYGYLIEGKMFRSRESVYTSFELDVMAEPSFGGMAIGSGTYLFGERAHLSASANENYQFVGWTNQNGDTISTEPEYAHMVARGGRITAHFASIDGVEESCENKIAVWPNPAMDVLHIEGCGEKARVFVYNVDGRKMQLTAEAVKGQLDLSTLLSGIYYLRIENNNKTIMKKIVKF